MLKKVSIILLFVFVFNTLFNGFAYANNSDKEYKLVEAKIVKIIDGETVGISINGEYKVVKLKGIKIPDNAIYKTKAISYLKKYEGKSVQIRFKESDVDKYGKLLVYLYIKSLLLNGSLITQGIALCLYANDTNNTIKNPDQYENTLIKLEETAKSKGIGIWNTAVKSVKGLNLNKKAQDLSKKVNDTLKKGLLGK